MNRQILKSRLAKVSGALKSCHGASALLLSSARRGQLSRDTDLPFRQNSDFYYLTGSLAEDLVLLIHSSKRQPIIYAPKLNAKKILWEGAGPNPAQLARNLGAQLIRSDDIEADLRRELRGVDCLVFQNDPNCAWEFTQKLMALRSHMRGDFPWVFQHSDSILAPLRIKKDPAEVAAIIEAGEITAAALLASLPIFRAGITEAQIAATIEHGFRMQGGTVAFPSIVAAGKNGAVLHHSASQRRLKNGELVVVDIGAQYEMYAADITRTLPVGGKFGARERALYEIVYAAHAAAVNKVRPGVTMMEVHEAAAREICYGLRELKIMKGSLTALVKNKAYRPFFPHSIGHSLGLDVHDIGNLRSVASSALEPGMVLTIEPGLYLPKAQHGFGPCGVRIEDDVLVTTRGAKILTPSLPRAPEEIEELLAELS